MTTWIGYPNSNGTPNTVLGTWGDYENAADRVYGKRVVATEAGTISHLNLRIGADWNPGSNGTFICVYNNGTKVGQSAISSPSTSAWTGELSVEVVSGQSLIFATDDVLVFGLAFDGGGSLTGLGMDSGLDDYNNQYAAVVVGATGPPSSVSFSTSGTGDGLGVILRYEDVSTTLVVPDLALASTIGDVTLTTDTLVMTDLVIATTIDNVVLENIAVVLDSAFESGNGVEAATFESPAGTYNIVSECDPAPADTSWGDWFYFSLEHVNGTAPTVTVDLENDRGGGPLWTGTHDAIRPVWSYDQATWNRLSSIVSYTGDVLTFVLPTMSQNKVYVAMDHPYTYTELVSDYATWAASGYTAAEVLGSSQGSRNIYYLKVEEAGYYSDRLEVVITGRAHSGEPQASHAMKGFMDWIISSDADAIEFRRKSILYVFPMVNPDGVYAGRLRSFNDGSDGNRGWDITGPDSGTEPAETFLIHTKIHAVNTNVIVCLDMHSNYWASPRMVYDATNDDWVPAELDAVVADLNTKDTEDYFYDAAYNMVTAYNTNFRRGQIEQYGYNALGIEGGLYAMQSTAYPTMAQRQTGGSVLVEAILDAMQTATATTIINQLMKANLGADLYNGALQ